MVNPERGGVEIKSADGTKVYVFRLGLTALAKLQKQLSTSERRMPLPQVLNQLQDVLDGSADADVDLEFLLQVMFAGLQEHHAGTVKTLSDVERVIEEAGGLDAFGQQMKGLRESLTPDPEDQKRRAANPRKARSKTN